MAKPCALCDAPHSPYPFLGTRDFLVGDVLDDEAWDAVLYFYSDKISVFTGHFLTGHFARKGVDLRVIGDYE